MTGPPDAHSLAAAIARAHRDPATCTKCDGDGCYIDYCDECRRTGEYCGCGGQERQCESCKGTGRVERAEAS